MIQTIQVLDIGGEMIEEHHVKENALICATEGLVSLALTPAALIPAAHPDRKLLFPLPAGSPG